MLPRFILKNTVFPDKSFENLFDVHKIQKVLLTDYYWV